MSTSTLCYGVFRIQQVFNRLYCTIKVISFVLYYIGCMKLNRYHLEGKPAKKAGLSLHKVVSCRGNRFYHSGFLPASFSVLQWVDKQCVVISQRTKHWKFVMVNGKKSKAWDGILFPSFFSKQDAILFAYYCYRSKIAY